MQDQQSYKCVFVFYLKVPRSTYEHTSTDIITVFHARPYGRFIEILSNLWRKKPHRTNQGSNFLRGSFSNRENVRAPIQFRRERQPQHLQRLFFLKNRLIYVHINNAIVLLDQSLGTSWIFLALKSTSHFLPKSIQCLVDQIQVHQPTLVVATGQIHDHT